MPDRSTSDPSAAFSFKLQSEINRDIAAHDDATHFQCDRQTQAQELLLGRPYGRALDDDARLWDEDRTTGSASATMPSRSFALNRAAQVLWSSPRPQSSRDAPWFRNTLGPIASANCACVLPSSLLNHFSVPNGSGTACWFALF